MSVADESRQRRSGQCELTIALLAALARLAYLAAVRPAFTGVPWALASELLHDHSLGLGGQPTTDYEPLYPLFLAACRVLAFDRAAVVQLLQVAVASLGAVYIYRLASSLAKDTRVAVLAGILFALDPLLVRESALLSESALVTTLLLAFAMKTATLETATDAAVAGLCLGATILTRTAALPILPLAAIVMAASRGIRPALTLTVTAFLLVAPMPVRNHLVNGSWWPTRSGLNLFVGNSPYSAALIPGDDVDLLQPYAAAIVRQSTSLSPDDVRFDRAADQVLAQRAFAWMRASPAAALELKIRNVGYLLSPRIVPYRTATETTRAVIDEDGRFVGVEHPHSRPPLEVKGYAVWQCIVLVATAFGVYRRRGDFRRDRILWCVAATFVGVHALYFPATRYRAPMEFVLLFFAAAGLQPAVDAAAAFIRHRDRRTVLEAAAALVSVRIGLWTLPYSAVARIVAGRGGHEAARRAGGDADRIGRIVTAVARRLPLRMTCLVEALAAQAMLRHRGYKPVMRFGVRSGERDGRAIDAHAWLVCDGRVVVGEAEARRYETLERAT